MRKIQNGKKYDTETAELICTVHAQGKIGHLFRKKNGSYFIWEHITYDEEIKQYFGPITDISEQAAKGNAEDNLSVEEYERFFGTVEE